MSDDEILTASSGPYSPSTERDEDEVARLVGASSSESSPATVTAGEDGEEAAERSAAPLAGEVPPRLAARMGSEHSAWTFAGSGAAQEAANLAARFCSVGCPIRLRCVGDECRVHRFEAAALAHIEYDRAQEPIEEFAVDA